MADRFVAEAESCVMVIGLDVTAPVFHVAAADAGAEKSVE